MSDAWAQIYGDDVGATYKTLTTAFERFPGSTLWTKQAGGYRFIKPDSTNTTALCFVTGQDGGGMYRISGSFSFTANVGNQTYHIAAFKNSTKIGQCSVERKLGTAGDVGAASWNGFVSLNPSTDIIDLRVQSTSTGVVVTINHMNFNLQRISTTT